VSSLTYLERTNKNQSLTHPSEQTNVREDFLSAEVNSDTFTPAFSPTDNEAFPLDDSDTLPPIDSEAFSSTGSGTFLLAEGDLHSGQVTKRHSGNYLTDISDSDDHGDADDGPLAPSEAPRSGYNLAIPEAGLQGEDNVEDELAWGRRSDKLLIMGRVLKRKTFTSESGAPEGGLGQQVFASN
jgi:hypothetical protein